MPSRTQLFDLLLLLLQLRPQLLFLRFRLFPFRVSGGQLLDDTQLLLLLLQLAGFHLCPGWPFHTLEASRLGFQLGLFIGQGLRIRQAGGIPFVEELRNGGIDVALEPFEDLSDPFRCFVMGQGSRNGLFHPRQDNGCIGQLLFGSLGRDRHR